MDGDGSWLAHLGLTAAVAIVPFIAIIGTSFAKVAIVLGITRSAIGAQGVPPNSVLTALAVVMSIFIMAPVADEMASNVQQSLDDVAPASKRDPLGMAEARKIVESASEPLLAFLERNTSEGNVAYFSDLAGDTVTDPRSLRIMLPSFALSELEEAFIIGFLILLPFFVVDLVVQNVLTAMGISTVSPTFASLPLKLLLLIATDGWRLIMEGLIVSYGL